jgi:hypothetical protein
MSSSDGLKRQVLLDEEFNLSVVTHIQHDRQLDATWDRSIPLPGGSASPPSVKSPDRLASCFLTSRSRLTQEPLGSGLRRWTARFYGPIVMALGGTVTANLARRVE